MKKIYTTLIFCLLITLAFAQNERYDFTSTTATYTPIVNGEALAFNPTDDWSDFDQLLEVEVEFGFSVPILGYPAVELFNFLTPALLVSNFDDEADDPILPFILPTTTQIQNRGVAAGNNPSEIIYQTTGAPGAQIFKLEYRDVGFANEWFLDNPSQDMFTNMQVWIYEESGCIEFHYGETSITDEALIYDGDQGSSTGLFRTLGSQLEGDTVLYAIFTVGDAQSPEVFEGENIADEAGSMSMGFPGNGVVYTFCPEIETSNNNLQTDLDWEVYPNPTLDFLTVNLNEVASANYSLISMNGQTIQTGSIDSVNKKVDVRGLSKGIYMLTVQTDKGIATKRFWKK